MEATLEKAFGYQGNNMNLPVQDVEAAVPFYETVLGFRVLSRSDTPYKSAVLARDCVQIGLAENGGDSSQDGCAFHVKGLESLFREFHANGLQKELSEFDIEQHDAAAWKVFYVVAPDGLCYWFGERQVDHMNLTNLATRYAAAWSSQNPAKVASFYAEHGSLKVNSGAPSVGRAAITGTAREFMTAFPDMVVKMDSVSQEGSRAIFRWTWTGTNTGPGGTGNGVRISGFEEWTIGADGLIAESEGHFDEEEYQRQLKSGAPAGR